jgi:hypothetical protein
MYDTVHIPDGIGSVSIYNRPIETYRYWVVNRICSCGQESSVQPRGNYLSLVVTVYQVYYYWLLIYNQLPKYQC